MARDEAREITSANNRYKRRGCPTWRRRLLPLRRQALADDLSAHLVYGLATAASLRLLSG